jgi:hypothetical protein
MGTHYNLRPSSSPNTWYTSLRSNCPHTHILPWRCSLDSFHTQRRRLSSCHCLEQSMPRRWERDRLYLQPHLYPSRQDHILDAAHHTTDSHRLGNHHPYWPRHPHPSPRPHMPSRSSGRRSRSAARRNNRRGRGGLEWGGGVACF